MLVFVQKKEWRKKYNDDNEGIRSGSATETDSRSEKDSCIMYNLEIIHQYCFYLFFHKYILMFQIFFTK